MQREGDTAHRARGEHPEDRFDRVERSGRVGAHRVTPKPRYFWQFFIAALLGFALLTTVGVLWVRSLGGISELPIAPKPTATEEAVAPALDPEATVAVLNGTQIEDLGANVDQTVTAEEWGVILFSGNAATPDVTESAVMYRDPADEAAALGLAEKLGGLPTYQTDEYGEYDARLIVVLGSDYAGPGLDGPPGE